MDKAALHAAIMQVVVALDNPALSISAITTLQAHLKQLQVEYGQK